MNIDNGITPKKAREIVEGGYISYPPTLQRELVDRCNGFLEGVAYQEERAKGLVEALEQITLTGLDPSLGQIVGSEHYEDAWLRCWEIANKAIAQFRKERGK